MMRSESSRAVLVMATACVIWGLAPIFWKALSHINAVEMLAHRSLWSAVFLIALLAAQGRLGAVRDALRLPKQAGLIALAAVMIAVNWGLFIWAVGAEHAVEASLGYYIFPLFAVLLGRFVFGERLRGLRAIAVVIASVAVIVLTIGLGAAPWIALVLGLTFGIYGLLKKPLGVGPLVSVTAEVVILLPVAAGYLIWTYGQNPPDYTTLTWGGLVAAGIVTSTPLVLMSNAARRLDLATLGVTQYINPTLQFLVAALVFLEPVTLWHVIALSLIWIGLGLYSYDAFRRQSDLS